MRLYNAGTAEIEFEYLLIKKNSMEEGESLFNVDFLNLDENIYLIRAHIAVGLSESNFVGISRRFEYIVVEIEGYDDE